MLNSNTNTYWTNVSTKVAIGAIKTFYAWGGVMILTFNLTPIWGGVNGRMLEVFTNSILLLTTNVGVIVNSTLVTIGMVKSITIKHELPQIGLVTLMVVSTYTTRNLVVYN
jgi:hypothetical protein